MRECTLNNPEIHQCCCNCEHHVADYHHCNTSPELRASEGRCICSQQRGWICLAPELESVYSSWPEHSVGCEMYSSRGKKCP